VSVLDGQKRSTYSFWVEGLQGVGFTPHAFGLFHSGASGDLHDRQRLLSVHSRTPCFSPAAALGSLLSPDEGNAPRSHSAQRAQHQLPVHDLWVQCDKCAKWRVLPHGSSAEHLAGERWVCALHSDERYSRCDTVEEDQVSAERRVAQEDSFSFTIGTGADRAALHGVRPAYGRIRPYNRNLDTAIFFRGVYYHVGQWLAHRASGLPETYQRSACITLQRAALGNMVGPLLARDLGYAVATEWSCPMQQRRPDPTPSMPLRPDRSHWRRGLPASFPRSGASGAVLAFTCASTGEWRAVRGRSWRFAAPPVRLDELCAQALARGDLTPLGGGRECDLRRVAADVSLSEYARHCARRQLVGLGLSPLPIHERLTVRQWAHHAPRSSAPIVCSRAELERRVPGATLCKGTRVLTLPAGAASPLVARVERLHSNATVTLRGDDGEARRLPVGAVSRLSHSELSPIVDIPATWEMPLMEDAQNKEGPIVDKVLRHVLYRGASPGSLYNVYVRLQFSDGGRTTYYLPAESIADRHQRPDAVRANGTGSQSHEVFAAHWASNGASHISST